MIKLFVVGFPREMDEMELAQLFAPFGDIKLLTIARDKIGGKSKGLGFIQMVDRDGAQQAIEALNGYVFGDRQMEVRVAEEKFEPVKPPIITRKIGYIPVTGNSPVRKKRPRLSK
jgi:RNA recognition motif-containing protein